MIPRQKVIDIADFFYDRCREYIVKSKLDVDYFDYYYRRLRPYFGNFPEAGAYGFALIEISAKQYRIVCAQFVDEYEKPLESPLFRCGSERLRPDKVISIFKLSRNIRHKESMVDYFRDSFICEPLDLLE